MRRRGVPRAVISTSTNERRSARGGSKGQLMGRDRRGQDSSLGLRGRRRRQNAAVSQGRQRRGCNPQPHRRGDRVDPAADLGGRHHRRAVGAAARVAGPGRPAGALRVGTCSRGDERCICRRGQDRRQGRPRHRRAARLRRDLAIIDTDTDLVRNLAVLTGHRADLIADRVRMINRLRDLMTSVFPSLERAFDYSSHKGALVLLTGYASPDRIRRIGQTRLAAWLRTRHVRGFADVAARAIAAAKAQSVVLAGQDLTASIIAELAGNVLRLDERLKSLYDQIEELFQQHPQAAIIQSMPGFGPFLGASLLVGAGDLRAFPNAGHLAAAAGLVPVPNDSGRRTGNLHRPLRYSRPLRHVCYLSAQTSMMRAGPNRDYYLKKRAHGRTHSRAVIALARRRIDVLWALLRENRTWTATPPQLAQAA